MSSKSAKVDSLIREHLTLNEGLHAQAMHTQSQRALTMEGTTARVDEPSVGEASAAQRMGEASTARVTEIRQELVQILQSAPADRRSS